MTNRVSRSMLGAVLGCLLAGPVSSANAQAGGSSNSVGVQLTALRLSGFDATNAGFGGRLSHDLSRWLALEGDVSLFVRDDVEIDNSTAAVPGLRLAYSRRRVEGFFGLKAGVRLERFGLFAKARPGFSRLTDRGVGCAGDVCALVQMLIVRPTYRTELALDVGGVLEFYPSSRTVARLDLGTTLIRHRSDAPPCTGCTTSNFTSRFGLGLRF